MSKQAISAPWPFYSPEEIAATTAILQSGKVNYWTGEQGRLFEQEYAQYVGTKYAIAMMNGTVALEAALFALNIGPGDEVITSCRTFIASASAIVLRNATPVLADVDPTTQNITPETIAAVLTPRTKAIIVVHLAGWPCEMDRIMALAKEHNLKVIEDCAQAHGASYQGQQVGSWGDISAFSFCQDKIITTGGEGGMVTTNDHALWDKMWSYKDHGKSFDAVHHRDHPPGFRWLHESFGTNLRMTELQAAIGRIQLQKLNDSIRIRQRNANILNNALSACKAVRLTLPPQTVNHAYYKFYAFIRPHQLKADWTRDRIIEAINAAGVFCQMGSCSEIYREQAFIQSGLEPASRHPIAKSLGETSLLFLVHPTLSENHMHEMAKIILEVISTAS